MNETKKTDFSDWAGLGLEHPVNENPKFNSDDDLWKSEVVKNLKTD